MLPFHTEVLKEFIGKNGLLVMAPGLGLNKILRHLIAMHSVSGTVLVLNTSPVSKAETIFFVLFFSDLDKFFLVSQEEEAWLIDSIAADPVINIQNYLSASGFHLKERKKKILACS